MFFKDNDNNKENNLEISLKNNLQTLQAQLEGELDFSDVMRKLYATDASAYREMPFAVAYPKNDNDLKKLIIFANNFQIPLIPRTAGTSLAGQVVGKGIIVDVSKYFTNILEINEQEKYIRIQPAIIRNDLNAFLAQYQLYFGPETATASRAMLGGMVGNNSCGSNSIIYGSTREHVLEITGFLSDGSKVVFGELSKEQYQQKLAQNDLEGKIYQKINEILTSENNQKEIRKEFPKKTIDRRNTGYALDLLLDSEVFIEKQQDNISTETSTEKTKKFNLANLICGSEGTLTLITELKLNLSPLPPKNKVLVCVHCNSIDEALRANLVAVSQNPSASELIDHYILECTKENLAQQQNRFFVLGEPKAILAVELFANTKEEVYHKAEKMILELENAHLGHHFPIVDAENIAKVWALRNAGLGLLSNLAGDAKPVCVVEDTAVDVQDLPEYIREFNLILQKYGLYSVHYAHAGTGELHLRPILNLKTQEGHTLFRKVAEDTAKLVKKYKGSLSGEHGDGRLRGEFIKLMVGEVNYTNFKAIKQVFDENGIFNPNKIVDTPPMDESLRYRVNHPEPQITTFFDFDKQKGILRLAEKCNGSGDCRKTEVTGGVMCPSYMATRNEKDTTRARANILREILTNSDKKNPFDSEEIKEVMDLCLSCKGCKSECPSNVDMGKMKAEFLAHYYEANGVPFRTKLIANFSKANKLAALLPSVYNFFVTNNFTSKIFKKIAGFAPKRSLPTLYKTTLKDWYTKNHPQPLLGKEGSSLSPSFEGGARGGIKVVYLFCDEFTNYNDTEIGIKTIKLLQTLGYVVIMPIEVKESGRTYLSKGLLKEAKKIANNNVNIFKNFITDTTPLIGIEPSGILSFRDEYLDLVDKNIRPDAEKIAKNAFLLDEFLANEIDAGNISAAQFHTEKKLLKLHGHCYQKALSSLTFTKKVLSLPKNYEMHVIASGCCGMAGAFGYESEHYDVSMQVGELILFPAVRKQAEDTIIVASGTSCRHQIKDGTNKMALHLAEVLWDAVIK